MEKLEDNINRFLPFGDSLRAILQHPTIKATDIKQLLRLKGVFVEDLDDENTFPLLITSLISPFEFEFIKERLKTREDREKTITRTLQWNSQEKLINAIPEDFDIQQVIKTTFPKYRVVGSPNFSMIDGNPDRIALDFKCETDDYSKEWYRARKEFKGQIALEKIITSGKVQLQIVHTSPETTEISDKVVRRLEKHFKDNNFMDSAQEIQRILFNDFTNEDRVRFFLRLTDGNAMFQFQKASYLDIGPDPSINLPEDISWLESAKVKDLNINGEVLHEIHFIKKQELHKYMELCEMEVLYNFSHYSAEGQCRIRFGFQGYFNKRLPNIEFVVDIVKIILKENSLDVNLPNLRTLLLKEFDKLKTEKYDSIQPKVRT